MIDGDIFRWRYKDEKPIHLGSYGRYHCKSQIAIARGGFLSDTYWSASGSDQRWSYEGAERELTLEHLGNLSDLENQPEYLSVYYDDADCVDLNHANSSKGNFYVRKSAVRSREKMRTVLAERVQRIEGDISFAQTRLGNARDLLAAIERGDSIDEMHL